MFRLLLIAPVAWVQKLAYYYSLWVHKGSPTDNFSEQDHADFAEDDEWLDWACALLVEDPAYPKIQEFRDWRPCV